MVEEKIKYFPRTNNHSGATVWEKLYSWRKGNLSRIDDQNKRPGCSEAGKWQLHYCASSYCGKSKFKITHKPKIKHLSHSWKTHRVQRETELPCFKSVHSMTGLRIQSYREMRSWMTEEALERVCFSFDIDQNRRFSNTVKWWWWYIFSNK